MTAESTTRSPQLARVRQAAMYQRARQSLPGGTNSNFRAWGESTIYVDRGKGGDVWDIDGNRYVDLRMGYGPVVLGHDDERVDDYVNERMRLGVSFSLTSEDEVRAIELIKELNPWVGKARMTVSGTEATMHAMRVARAYTGRNKIVKFEGQYHGVHDYALISVLPNDMSTLGDADSPVGLAWGRGIPEAVANTIVPARYNNLDLLRRLFEQQGEDIAAIIVEPVLGNAQGIMPKPGFHQAMRALTEEFGILLIFDEVKTGFRFSKGGAAEYFGITPDIATYAKAMGNGYPAAAFGGSDEIMSVLPDKVSHGGTYAGNRVAAAAAVKTLEILRDTDALATIRRTGETIQAGVRERLDAKGLAYQHHRPPVDVRDHVHRDGRQRVSRLGDHRPRAVRRDRRGHARARGDARAGQSRAVVHVRGSRPGRHRRPRRVHLRRIAGCSTGGTGTGIATDAAHSNWNRGCEEASRP